MAGETEQGVCPHCGSHYTERYSGWDRTTGVVTFHCFNCGIDYDVSVDAPEPDVAGDEATQGSGGAPHSLV